MKLFFLFIAFFPVNSFAFGILFNLRGDQTLVQVGQGGGVTSDATIVWDESKDGPLPSDAPIGYAERFTTQELQDGPDCSNADEIKAAVKAKQKPIPICAHIQILVDVPHLRANADLKTAKDAADAAAVKDVSDKAAAKSAVAALKVKIKAKTATAADVRDAVGAIMDALNLGN